MVDAGRDIQGVAVARNQNNHPGRASVRSGRPDISPVRLRLKWGVDLGITRRTRWKRGKHRWWRRLCQRARGDMANLSVAVADRYGESEWPFDHFSHRWPRCQQQ